jgi:hypothetical protein
MKVCRWGDDGCRYEIQDRILGSLQRENCGKSLGLADSPGAAVHKTLNARPSSPLVFGSSAEFAGSRQVFGVLENTSGGVWQPGVVRGEMKHPG